MSSRRLSPSRRRADVRAWWRERLVAQRQSGQTQVAYCEAQGLDPTYFSMWKRRLARDSAVPVSASRPPRPTLALVPVVRKQTGGAGSPSAEPLAIRIILRNGLCVALEIPSLHNLPSLLGELAQTPC
jgi:hypothetical protein